MDMTNLSLIHRPILLMYSPLFAALYVLFIAGLSANVSRLRIREKVSLGDGGNKIMQKAIRAHGNAVENLLPFALLLLAYEAQGGPPQWILGMGSLFLITRVFHAWGMLGSKKFRFRRWGAGVTIFLHVSLALLILIKFQG